MKISIILVVAIVLCCSGCKPKDEYFYVDSEIVSGYTYPSGSYWIYKDDATGGFDSLSYTGQATGYGAVSGAAPHTIGEAINSYMSEYERGKTVVNYKWELKLYADRTGTSVGLWSEAYMLLLFRPIFTKPSTSGVLNEATNKYNKVEYLSSVTINNQTFDNVYHTSFISKDGSQPTEHIYINRTVGILKIEHHSGGINRTLEIESWHVPR